MLHKRREKFRFQEKLIVNILGKLPITPNEWTLISLAFVFIGLYFTITHKFALALVFFVVSLFLDIVDGAIARAKNMVSNRGAYIDTVVDRYVEGIMLFGLLFIPYFPVIIFPIQIWIALSIFGFMITTYSKAAAYEKQLKEEAIQSTLEKSFLIKRAERAIFYFSIYLTVILNQFYIAAIILIAFAVLTNITAVRKILAFVKYERNNL
ncbi:MAG: CDP-alcohol phosphatidyltransferase family protein [Candidatus Pacebacteria bacterium]|nr:CDP-alcohol phosphatidyltransferase family protein [Candidatus Paceibacterota bacterium]